MVLSNTVACILNLDRTVILTRDTIRISSGMNFFLGGGGGEAQLSKHAHI